jgi:hypothetical protein
MRLGEHLSRLGQGDPRPERCDVVVTAYQCWIAFPNDKDLQSRVQNGWLGEPGSSPLGCFPAPRFLFQPVEDAHVEGTCVSRHQLTDLRACVAKELNAKLTYELCADEF